MKHLGDITKINGAEITPVDCITFGAPCQDLSVAGARAGMKHEANGDEETTRSGLFFEAIRIIEEMRENDRLSNGRTGQYVRPRFAIYENVPGAFSSNGGKDFQAVLNAFVKVADPEAPDVPMPNGGANGQTQGACTMSWESGVLLGEYRTDSFGERPNTLTEEQSFSALPNGVSASRLSLILVDDAPQKYSLSAKACQGILNRAERRGKALPAELKEALEQQVKNEADDELHPQD